MAEKIWYYIVQLHRGPRPAFDRMATSQMPQALAGSSWRISYLDRHGPAEGKRLFATTKHLHHRRAAAQHRHQSARIIREKL